MDDLEHYMTSCAELRDKVIELENELTLEQEKHDSTKLELEAEKHAHLKDNAYMVDVKHRLLDALEAIRTEAEKGNMVGLMSTIRKLADDAIKDISHG